MEINESMLPVVEEVLTRMGWNYQGCDQWEDPVTGSTYGVIKAYEIQLQRNED